ncbi:Ser/Thr protein kinase RdoA involved in Cpx stress response, MazF antagonist [Variovorax sp. HW608]|uniref:phosphotransferase n=1 Tax=Variovorax sp. HW608 TaxID=1034889 RepID=UPI00081F8DD6|nr:phosphotransferase [Variovorax sp. HW608]SCK43262.1 Ser/Thr protein kinase RdoA involved in Cpx stress response, MazF antagonist [Variovorax sp. HW608]
MTTLSSIFGACLTQGLPPTPQGLVEALVRERYGVDARAVRLASERDELFLLTAADGGRLVLRFAHPADDPSVLDMQVQALQWIAAADSTLPIPALLKDSEGCIARPVSVGDAAPRVMTLSSFLEGQLLSKAPRSSRQRRALGAAIASFDTALQDFAHQGADHELLWDIQRAAFLNEIIPETTISGSNPPRPWNLVRDALRHFEAEVQPRLAGLRAQVIHGDFNPHNVMVRADDPGIVSGIMDFGDMVRAPLVNDLAIAACYHLDGEAMHSVADIVTGFHSVLPLRPEELDLFIDLMATRLCAAVAITEWRARANPGNSTYILKNTTIAWQGLQRLAEMDRAQASNTLRDACYMERTT